MEPVTTTLTAATIFRLWLSTTDINEVLRVVKDLITPGNTVADTQALIRTLLDQAIPEELAGARGIAVMEPEYEKAAARLTEYVARLLRPKRRVSILPVNEAELARVAALIASHTATTAVVTVDG